MHVDAVSGTHVPAGRPVVQVIAPWTKSIHGSRRVTVQVSPWMVELPSITVEPPTITVYLPTIEVEVLVGTPVGANPLDARPRVRIDWGRPRVEVVPGKVTVTPTRLHAIPETDAVRALWFDVDLDSLEVVMAGSETHVQFTGSTEHD